MAHSDIEMGPTVALCTCFPSLDECHRLLLTSPLRVVTCLTVARSVCFTRLSKTASLMNKGRVNWPLLVSFEKRIQLKREYP